MCVTQALTGTVSPFRTTKTAPRKGKYFLAQERRGEDGVLRTQQFLPMRKRRGLLAAV